MSVLSCHTLGSIHNHFLVNIWTSFQRGQCRRPLVHINEIDGTVTFTKCLRDLCRLDGPNQHSEETNPTPLYQSDKTEKWVPSRESNLGPFTYMVNALTTELLDSAGNKTQIYVFPFLPHPWPWPKSLVGKSLDFLPKGMVPENSTSYKWDRWHCNIHRMFAGFAKTR